MAPNRFPSVPRNLVDAGAAVFVEAARRGAAWKSTALLGLVFLVTHDINSLMIGGAALGGLSGLLAGQHARTIDIAAAAHRLMDTTEPYMLLSGYRSPATNAMLRSHSKGVAKNSLHMKGMAADLRLKSRSVSQMAKAAEACSAGGVGHYYGSNFVHMDCGPVRTWGG